MSKEFLVALKEIFIALGEYLVWPVVVGVGLGALGYLKWIIDKLKDRHSVKFNGQKSVDLQQKLTELRVLVNADRAFFTMFHNGDRYIDGSPLIKSSRISEVCGPGITHEAKSSQSIIISLFPEVVTILFDKPFQIMEPSEFPNTALETRLKSQGVKFFIRCPIKKGKDLVGVVGIDYVLEDEKPLIDSKQIAEYSKAITAIAIS